MNTRDDEIYQSITKKQVLLLFIAGSFIGGVIFILCYGVNVLHVTNDAWLLAGGDLNQHYLGWKYYRKSPWHFPIGMIDGLVYPDQLCVIFTDSIPLFAIFFKILSPILPETFQYFGLWGIMTFCLMGGISAVIIRKSTKNIWFCIIGSVFFSYSPYVFHRMYGHTALAGNWLILAAIGLWLYKPFFCTLKRKIIAWGLLLMAGSLVHIYYIPMIMIFMFFSCVQDIIEHRAWKNNIILLLSVIAADLAVLGCTGAFSSTASMQDSGLGVFSANLNALINSFGNSAFLKRLPANDGQYEGFGYLGFGMLILVGISLISMVVLLVRKSICKSGQKSERKGKQQYAFPICMILAATVAMILAISPTITLNSRTLLIINYPEAITKILSIFRASGRFIWCVGYVIMFFAVMTLAKNFKKAVSLGIIILVVILQIADLKNFTRIGKNRTENYQYEPVFTSEQWHQVFDGKKHLIYIPYNSLECVFGSDGIYEMANMACDHDMTVNHFIAARIDRDNMQRHVDMICSELESGNAVPEDTVYILDSEETGKRLGLRTCVIDQVVVGTAQ